LSFFVSAIVSIAKKIWRERQNIDRDFHIFDSMNNLRITQEMVNYQIHVLTPAFEDFMLNDIETAALLNLILFDPGEE
jgi:hypothetical protein